ncbi:MAG: arginine--tRNA ligase [Methanomicrobia archaeon]|nr:arginine--tRNA ligase [Methanomicrobia archaeon]
MYKEAEELLRSIVGDIEIVFSDTPDPKLGDFSSTVAFNLAKKTKKNPNDVAKEIISDLKTKKTRYIKEIKNMGPYINFFVDYDTFGYDLLKKILDEDWEIEEKKEKVIVEHTSANPNKPLHMGHLRNAILGDTLARIFKFLRYNTEIQNYIDDLGIQVAETLWSYKNLKFDENKKFDHLLGEIYVEVEKIKDYKIEKEIRALNKEMEEDSSVSRPFVERCLKAQLKTLSDLDISYDVLIFESDLIKSKIFDEAYEKIKQSKDIVLEEGGENKGCLVMKLGNIFPDMENPDKILIRSDGTATYTGKDVAYHLWKFGLVERNMKYLKWNSLYKSFSEGETKDFGNGNTVINVIGVEQRYPQEVVKLSLELLGYSKKAENFYHLAYEHVSLPEEKFSGRKGTWIGYTGDELIEEAFLKAKEEVESRRHDLPEEKKVKIAKAVASGAIRYNIVKYAPEKKIIFRWKDALNFEGDSSPYIQYAHARCCSILKKAELSDFTPNFSDSEEKKLIKTLYKFVIETEKACNLKRPHILTKYLNDLATVFNSFYNSLKVLGSEEEAQRLALVKTTQIVLKKGLSLLGIEALEEM